MLPDPPILLMIDLMHRGCAPLCTYCCVDDRSGTFPRVTPPLVENVSQTRAISPRHVNFFPGPRGSVSPGGGGDFNTTAVPTHPCRENSATYGSPIGEQTIVCVIPLARTLPRADCLVIVSLRQTSNSPGCSAFAPSSRGTKPLQGLFMNELLRFEKGCWARSTRLSQRRWTAGQACWANRSERVCVVSQGMMLLLIFFCFLHPSSMQTVTTVSGVAENKE